MRRSGRPWDVVPSGAARRPDARGVVACFALTERTTPAASRHGGVEQPHPTAGREVPMARSKRKNGSGTRLQIGAGVLSAARAIDTRLVKGRLGRFERAHRAYVAAQRKVDAAESRRTAQARLAECDAVQDEAVETLARALVADGQPRGNPFEAFAALKRGARAAADEGAPDLYPTLFRPVIRAITKSKTPEEQAPPVTATPAAA